MSETRKYYIMMVSMHGLVHATHMELGRDPDTGGQIKYVVELARALIRHPQVEEVELVTRKIVDPKVSPDYSLDLEEIEEGVRIIRLPCGPSRYIRKEALWPYMDNFADAISEYLRKKGTLPDIIHGHYADAGYVCARVAALFEIPMAFTGHSLGRVKEQRLLAQKMKPENIEKNYNIKKRIEGEEVALENASIVVVSTRQEVEEQYKTYQNYTQKRFMIISPGVDLSKFMPPAKARSSMAKEYTIINKTIPRFLKKPKKPMVLAICRPDPKKNIIALVHAFAQNEELRKKANLLLLLGTREDIAAMPKAQQHFFNELLYLIDRYDLYGSIAIPKMHQPEDIPHIYRLAASSKGVFVNPALTEPFGLTLLEAAASGLPVVATENGGAREILETCRNGLLIDPLNVTMIGDAVLDAMRDKTRWSRFARMGIANSQKHYSWSGHVNKYIKTVSKVINWHEKIRSVGPSYMKRLVAGDRLLVCDIDDTLTGDKEALDRLMQMLRDTGDKVTFGIATGRSLKLTQSVLKEWGIPHPNFLVTSVGSEIYYGKRVVRDLGWQRHINYRWNRDTIMETLTDLPGIKPQGVKGQAEFKVSYFMDPEKAPRLAEISRMLRKTGIRAKVVFSHGQYLDILPLRASKGLAIRYLAIKWGIPFKRILVGGDSGNDEDMLTGNVLAVVVSNHTPELAKLRGQENIYFAQSAHAGGIIEGIDHYDFFGVITPERKETIDDADGA